MIDDDRVCMCVCSVCVWNNVFECMCVRVCLSVYQLYVSMCVLCVATKCLSACVTNNV